ncbi:MgtC/SapB family protein [Hydrogenophaga luteola]|uniref:MgtC/SapB family protein n=1 Tax=Hydrogenophaga luteola TaxID=1591122 RepID=A0ABV7W3X5_9BURK
MLWNTSPPIDAATATATLLVALGCGLLVGIERERRKGSGPNRAFAGLRTFAVTSVAGAAAALTQIGGLVVAGALLVIGLTLLAYQRDRSDDPGATTEIALLLTYLTGVLGVWSLPLAAGLAVGLTALLAGRERLHQFALHWLRPGEVRDGIVLAALALMALPLVPDQSLWGTPLNPHKVVQLLVLLLGVQSVAHLAGRLLAARHAVAVSALASGFVSSTATIATLGLAVREQGARPRLMAGGGLLSCVSTQLQLLLVAAAMQPAWLAQLWLLALVGAGVVALWGWVLLRGAPTDGDGLSVSSPRIEGLAVRGGDRMFSLRGAAAVAMLLSSIQLVVHALQRWLGDAGLVAGALVAALADLHSALAAVFSATTPVSGPAGVWAVALALLVHAASKSVTAGLTGGAAYLRWLAPGLWLHTVLVAAGVVWMGSA